MRLVLAKPAMAAFPKDLRRSVDVLDFVESEMGFRSDDGTLKVSDDLTLELGLQLILRAQDMESLGDLEKNVGREVGDMPLAVHAPCNYDMTNPGWVNYDLTNQRTGMNKLMGAVSFADRVGATSVVVHPNALRAKKTLTNPDRYSATLQGFERANILGNIMEIIRADVDSNVSIDVENKPIPAEEGSVDDRAIYCSGVLATYMQMQLWPQSMTFDTCHYGVTRNTINKAVSRGKAGVDFALKKWDLPELVRENYIKQPSVRSAMEALGRKINHVHLSDGSVFQPDQETGLRVTTFVPSFREGVHGWVHGYVPLKGDSLCRYETIIPWLRNVSGDQIDRDKRRFLTAEVAEFDGDYEQCPRSREALVGTTRTICESLSG